MTSQSAVLSLSTAILLSLLGNAAAQNTPCKFSKPGYLLASKYMLPSSLKIPPSCTYIKKFVNTMPEMTVGSLWEKYYFSKTNTTKVKSFFSDFLTRAGWKLYEQNGKQISQADSASLFVINSVNKYKRIASYDSSTSQFLIIAPSDYSNDVGNKQLYNKNNLIGVYFYSGKTINLTASGVPIRSSSQASFGTAPVEETAEVENKNAAGKKDREGREILTPGGISYNSIFKKDPSSSLFKNANFYPYPDRIIKRFNDNVLPGGLGQFVGARGPCIEPLAEAVMYNFGLNDFPVRELLAKFQEYGYAYTYTGNTYWKLFDATVYAGLLRGKNRTDIALLWHPIDVDVTILYVCPTV